MVDVIEQQQPDVIERMEQDNNTKKLFVLLQSCLTKREREILVLRYGLNGNKEATQNQVGEKLGISRSYVSRIEKKAIEKLRAEFENNSSCHFSPRRV